MTRHAVRRGSKLLVAATMAAAAAAIVPAHAVIGTPVMQGNSVPNGFTKTASVVAVTYDKKLAPLQSTVTVTDVNGDPVSGSTLVPLGNEKTLVFQTTLGSLFNEDLSPYTATFAARANNQALATPTSSDVLTFDVDFVTPFPPDVHLNDGAPMVGPTLSIAEEELTINVDAADIVPESGIVSGIRKVDVHFYNPLANPLSLTPAGIPEVGDLHQTITLDCTGGCDSVVDDLTVDISDLTLGYWNIKVSVTDAAGNQSAQSAPMAVLRLVAPGA